MQNVEESLMSGEATLEAAEGSEDSESEEDDDFFASLTSEQIEIIRKKQESLKRGYNKFATMCHDENIRELVSDFDLTAEEATVALDLCEQDEIKCKKELSLNTDEFKQKILDSMLLKKYPRQGKRMRVTRQREASIRNAYTDPSIKIKIKINSGDEHEDISLSKDLKELISAQSKKSSKKKIKKGYKVNGEKRAKNIPLTEALALLKEKDGIDKSGDCCKVIDEDYVVVDNITYKRSDLEKLEWSEARIKSFLSINSNPNSYYYRFNHPGEQHRTGNWSKEEVDLFMDSIRDGCNYRWGEFSMRIKGRVGYQCSNFYRKLIQEGKISDPNYVLIDGKLKFLGKDGKRFTRKREEAERRNRLQEQRQRAKALKRLNKSQPKERKRRHKKTSRRRRSNEDYILGATSSAESETESEIEVRGIELIRGLQCPMTFKRVLNPAVSPFGHIMSYDTWVRVLFKNKNRCPFTNQRLTRRMLTKLNKANVLQHVDAIKKLKPDFTKTDLLDQ